MSEFRLPNNTQRIAVVGRTGSGKTQFGSWVLSEADYDKRPYVIVDYKGDDLLNAIEGIRHIDYGDKLDKRGLHIIHPRPDEDEKVEAFLWKLWEKENTGLFIDEGYMIPDKGAFNAILTQGRSKKIPTITLSQRPVRMSRFVFSEADFFAIFHLNHEDDEKTVNKFISKKDKGKEMPEYHSKYYDVARNELFYLRPVPNRDTILDRFEERTKSANIRAVRFV